MGSRGVAVVARRVKLIIGQSSQVVVTGVERPMASGSPGGSMVVRFRDMARHRGMGAGLVRMAVVDGLE